MKKLTVKELKDMWLSFYEERGHKNIGSASLIPENDATVLFTTAGMHPLVPYLLGEKHPAGTRLCDIQKCIRTNDIDEVGDKSHLTFFEMLGNWSLGDYFKEEMVPWSYEFLTSPKYLGIPVERLAVTAFEGDENSPKDTETADLWAKQGMPRDQIFFLPKSENWWALGSGVGPCGPDTEMFYVTDKPKCSPNCNPSCDCGRYLEIWNDVFMQFKVDAPNTPVKPLAQRNVDTGMGLERVICISNDVETVYETEIFMPTIRLIESLCGTKYEDNKKAFRIICDHIRCATMIMGDEKAIAPSNVGQGYILRRLIRRALNYARNINLNGLDLIKVSDSFVDYAEYTYPEVRANQNFIREELAREINKFQATLASGHKEFDKVTKNMTTDTIDGATAFRLYDTFGFPLELTIELAKEKGLKVDEAGYKERFSQHQQISKQGSEQLFKGGLADTSEASAHLHTATHLLLGALRTLIDPNIEQRGSNITPERMRLDFNFPRKLTPEEIKMLEDRVNEAIEAGIDVTCEEMSPEEAHASGALGIFNNKYGNIVKVYTMGKYSKEICGGPHAKNTRDLHHFKIVKEESSSSGIRRIKAILD